MNPPSDPIFDYSIEEWPKDLVYPPCRKCGSAHGMGVKDTKTGEITPMDVCYKCLWENVHWKPITEQIFLVDLPYESPYENNMSQLVKRIADQMEESQEQILKD
jgi:hypothetical protein